MGEVISRVAKKKGIVKAGSLLLLSIPLLWWAIRDIPVADIYATIIGVNPAALLGLVLVNGLILLLLVGRWWLVFYALGHRLPFPSLVLYRLAGFGVSYFTPGPQIGGEPFQVHLLQKHHHLPRGTALAGISVDKLIEMLLNFSFLFLGLILVFKAQLLSISVLVLPLFAGLLALPVIYMTLIQLGIRPISLLLMKLSIPDQWMSTFARIRDHVFSAEEQVASFVSKNPRYLLGALSLSFITWALMIFEYWLTLRLFGVRLELTQVILMLTAARVAFLMPVPAGLGALEAGQVAAMQILGLEPTLGISVSLLIRARDFTLGSLGLWLGGFSASSPRSPSGVQAVPIPLERSDKV